ncbi:hypothetical protein C2G38_2184571 [Gigaspora rosea]|uniref:Zn(2)-C6 fungal-type domain-containing protein n=1 Tax=Gigaspora rosea TaxID=44941 RepID=A0A397V929_9GLOM|nr:hypothetical protein C2G38_2184571 [Gigaspora rosea]
MWLKHAPIANKNIQNALEKQQTCKRCKLRNFECTFIDSGKKRGPKTNGKHSEQVTDRLYHHPSEYPQLDNIDELTHYSDPYDEKNTYAF